MLIIQPPKFWDVLHIILRTQPLTLNSVKCYSWQNGYLPASILTINSVSLFYFGQMFTIIVVSHQTLRTKFRSFRLWEDHENSFTSPNLSFDQKKKKHFMHKFVFISSELIWIRYKCLGHYYALIFGIIFVDSILFHWYTEFGFFLGTNKIFVYKYLAVVSKTRRVHLRILFKEYVIFQEITKKWSSSKKSIE